jgi:hypothetical protein
MQPPKKRPVLLRFVSKNGIDFNAISTGFSAVEAIHFPSKKPPKLSETLAELRVCGSQLRPISIRIVKDSYSIAPTEAQSNQTFP